MTDIGPDPIKWVEKLLEVSASSQFTGYEKIVIRNNLRLLIKNLNPDITFAPWTSGQVDRLNLFQRNSEAHEFTCANSHEDADHTLIATKAGWICPHCDYKQNWAHTLMLKMGGPS